MKNVKNRFVGNKISNTSKKYIPSFIFYNKKNNVTLPLNTSALYTRDPKALAFISSRHKFIGKMIEGKKKVLDIGCGDGFGTTIVSQFVKKIVGMPSIESQKYASAVNKKEHINCKTGKSLKLFCENFFKSVFLFSMNSDEPIYYLYLYI